MFSTGVSLGQLSGPSNGIFEHSLSANGPIDGRSVTINLMGVKVTPCPTVAAPSGALAGGAADGAALCSCGICGGGGKTGGIARVVPSSIVGDGDHITGTSIS